MANREILAKLKESIVVWNQWREENPYVKPDLKNANLKNANLKNANLKQADLRWAILEDANLVEADLRGAILTGAKLHRANLSKALLEEANLDGAKLNRTILIGADLESAILSGASLRDANLCNARMPRIIAHGTDLQRTILTRVSLAYADLFEANFQKANLTEANLHHAKLIGTDLSEASLKGADLSYVDGGNTKFSNTIYDSQTIWPGAAPAEATYDNKQAHFRECLPILSVYNLEIQKLTDEYIDPEKVKGNLEKLLDENPMPKELQEYIDPSDIEKYKDQVSKNTSDFFNRPIEEILGDPSLKDFDDLLRKVSKDQGGSSSGENGGGFFGTADIWSFWRCVLRNAFKEAVWMFMIDSFSKIPVAGKVQDKLFEWGASLTSLTVPEFKIAFSVVMLGKAIYGVWYGCRQNQNS